MTFSNLFGKQSNVFWRIFYSFIILFQDHLTAFHLPKLLGRVVYIEIWCTIWFPSRHRHMLNYPCHDPSGHLLSKSNNNNLSQRPTGQAPLAESAVYTLCHINNFCPCLHDQLYLVQVAKAASKKAPLSVPWFHCSSSTAKIASLEQGSASLIPVLITLLLKTIKIEKNH